MPNKILGSCGVGVRIEIKGLDQDRLWKEILQNELLNKFIPDFSTDGEVIATLQVINSLGPRELQFDCVNSFVSGVFGKDFNSTDVIVLVEYILERHRQERGIYTVHSSSVYKSNKGVLLIANLTGAGKTSSALYLSDKAGFSIYSDEKTLVSPKGKMLVGQVEKIYLEDKTSKSLNDVGIKKEKEITIPKTSEKELSLIIVPVVTNGLRESFVRKYSASQLKWLLYEEFSKDIRLVNGMIFNMSAPLMPLDTQKIAEDRLDQAGKLSKAIDCYLIQGSLSQIAKEVDLLISRV